MGKAASRSKSLICLNVAKVKRVQKALGAKTEVEAIEKALDLVIAEGDNNRLVVDANERFLRSGVEMKDVYHKPDR
jgi:hypothetical protein